ncbi:MAG: hypothetical protein ABJA90_02055 [Ginsengibacter sp.]
MQSYLRIIVCSSIIFCAGCKQKETRAVSAKVPAEESIPFLPVTDFILGQLIEIEKLPVTPLQIIITGNREDSTWLKREDIRRLASPFLHPVIDSASMSKYFVGKSFLDQTINAFTFSYDVKAHLPDSIKLVHWDVYIDPQKNSVQRIYIVKEDTINNSHVTTQLTWNTDKWLSIRTIVEPHAKKPEVREEMLKWDFNE